MRINALPGPGIEKVLNRIQNQACASGAGQPGEAFSAESVGEVVTACADQAPVSLLLSLVGLTLLKTVENPRRYGTPGVGQSDNECGSVPMPLPPVIL